MAGPHNKSDSMMHGEKANRTPRGRIRGRPKSTWRRTVEKKRTEAGWPSWEEVKTVAATRDKWRDSV